MFDNCDWSDAFSVELFSAAVNQNQPLDRSLVQNHSIEGFVRYRC